MTSHNLHLFFDRQEPDGATDAPLTPRPRVVYVARGAATINGEEVAEDEAVFSTAGTTVAAAADGAILWRWELADPAAPPEVAEGPGVASRLAMAEPVDAASLADEGCVIFRCDSVAFPPGGCAYTHIHQGPGIRCLRDGAIRIDSAGTSVTYGPGEPWYEIGTEPVFAQADATAFTRFIRVMILPPGLKGKSSVRYINDEDLEKPKVQTHRGYADELVTL